MQLPPHRFLNYVYAWMKREMTGWIQSGLVNLKNTSADEIYQKMEMALNEPLPWETDVEQEIAPWTDEDEGAGFLAAMSA